MANYIINSYSLNMLADPDTLFGIQRPITKEDIPKDVISAIGHADTAKVISNELGFEVPANRISVSLKNNETAYIAQYVGPRLPEGATELPEGACIKYYKLEVFPIEYFNWMRASY